MLSGVGKALAAETTDFDTSILKARGIDPRLAEYFRSAPRFQKGRQRVALQVNGASHGQVQATFDEDGELCLDLALLERGAIQALPGLPEEADSAACLRISDRFSEARVRLDPGKEQVELLVPTTARLAPGVGQRSYARGGVAGLLNYDALTVITSSAGQSSQYRSLSTELGFNAGDWVLRSRQSYTSSQGEARFEQLYTHASRTWERYQAQVQLGQLNMVSPLFAGEGFTGVQILPEVALGQSGADFPGAGTAVQGVAYSPSRIEVRQSGVMIYTTLVPSGPFTLQDLPLLSHQLDIEMTVHEESGEQRQFRVSTADLRQTALGTSPGYGFSAGKVRRFGIDERQAPSFFALSKDWQWNSRTRFSTGLMSGTQYRSFGWGWQRALTSTSVLSLQQVVSKTPQSGHGSELQAAISSALTSRLSASLSAGRQTKGFRTLADNTRGGPVNELPSHASAQWSAALRGTDPILGALTATVSRYSTSSGQPRSRAGAAWSRVFDGATLSLNLEREFGSEVAVAMGTAVYLSVSLPLGRQRSLSSFIRHDNSRGLRSGARLSEQTSETLGYSLAVQRLDNGQQDLSGRLNLLPRYTSVDLGYSHSGAGSTNYDLALRGGLALHHEGVTASPYPLRDTFGLLKVGDKSGVKLRTPQGPVWTDAKGRAVAASLPAYRTSRIEIDTTSLQRHLDVVNGYQEVDVARGSVQVFDFKVNSARRLLLQVRTVDGEWAKKGLAVYNRQGQYLTNVVDGGTVYLADVPSDMQLQLVLEDGNRCSLYLVIPEQSEPTAPYEAAEVTCRATPT